MIRLVLLVSVLLTPSLAQTPAVAADPPGPRLRGSRWIAELLPPGAFLPRLEGAPGELTIWAPPSEVRTSVLEVGIGTGFEFSAGMRYAGGAGLLLAFGSDPWRTRGWELDCGAPGRPATLSKLGHGGAEKIATVDWLATGKPSSDRLHQIKVRVTGGALTLEVDGRKTSPRNGWRLSNLEPGRFHLGVAGGAVRLQKARLSFMVTGSTRRRLQARASRGPLVALPTPRTVPLQGPLDSIEIADLRGALDEPAVAALAELRQWAVDGKTREALEGLRALRARHPRAVGPAYVAGALRMLELADAPGALEDLRVARDLPGATALLGDALWMIGDLQSADAAYRRAGDAGGQALVLWARGQRTKAAALAAAGKSGGCRRAGQRLRLVDDLAMLHGRPGLHTVAKERVTVISDLSKSRAQRALRLTVPFLNAADGWMPGESSPKPLTVFVCAARDVFAQWNDRLGGARFEEADGIYRPGAGLMVVLDDDDGEVLRRRLQHECVHHVVWERGWAMPRPFEEGLCELLAHGRPAGRTIVRLDTPAGGRVGLACQLAEGGHLEAPATVMLRPELRDGDRGREDYAQAWASWWTLAGRPKGDIPLGELILLAGDPKRRLELQAALEAALTRNAVVKRLGELGR